MIERLDALTVWQPWADLLMLGAKPYEFRGHAAPRYLIGRRIVIHAGVHKWDRDELEDLLRQVQHEAELPPTDALAGIRLKAELAVPYLERLLRGEYVPPVGHGLGTMRLTAVHSVADYAPGFVNDSNRHEHFNFGWRFEDPQRFEPPIPARGQQGFWKWQGKLMPDEPFRITGCRQIYTFAPGLRVVSMTTFRGRLLVATRRVDGFSQLFELVCAEDGQTEAREVPA